MENAVITVRQLNNYVKSLIESDERLSYISVCGEISNFKNHYASGHWYFTLKDNDSQIRCVMFSANAARVTFEVRDGMKVIIGGRVSLYERDGQYQLYAETIKPEGEGDLAAAFNILKEKLEKEGLFDSAEKRPLPKFPRKIAVITSETGAAIRDILNILSKRYPVCNVLLCPAIVQGDLAAASMIAMLDSIYERADVDVIIIGRGGGSLEDLWAFNDEALARKIYESPVPVISAVGHETDFTICDFVADVRASTPSHAAELAVPDMRNLLQIIYTYKTKINNSLLSKYQLSKTRFDLAVADSVFKKPIAYFDDISLKLDGFADSLTVSVNEKISADERQFGEIIAKLDALSPIKTISRGYAAVKSGSKPIKSASDIEAGQDINLRFADGDADCKVTAVRSKL